MLTPQLHPSSSPPQRLIDYYGIKLDGKRLVLMIEDPKVAGRGDCAVLHQRCSGQDCLGQPGSGSTASLLELHTGAHPLPRPISHPTPQTAAKYLKADAKPSDIPEFLREFKVGHSSCFLCLVHGTVVASPAWSLLLQQQSHLAPGLQTSLLLPATHATMCTTPCPPLLLSRRAPWSGG